MDRSKLSNLTAMALVIGAIAACGRSDEDKRAEVASVTVAVDRLRDAPNQDKSDFLLVAKKTECSLLDVCALRDHCTSAYELQVNALAQIERMKQRSLLPENDPAEHLASIQAQLSAARDAAKACVDEEAKLLDRYKAKQK